MPSYSRSHSQQGKNHSSNDTVTSHRTQILRVQTVTQLASCALSADLNFMNFVQTNENEEEFSVLRAVKLNNEVFLVASNS